MTNGTTFNLYPLILAIIIGVIVAILAYYGIIAIGIFTDIFLVFLAVAVILLILGVIITINLNTINTYNNTNNIQQHNNNNNQHQCCNRFIYCECDICALLRTFIYTLIAVITFIIIGLLVTLAVANVLSAILIGIIFTLAIFTIITFLNLIICIINNLCNV